MTCLQRIRTAKGNGHERANRENIRRVFTKNLNNLYQLSLVLTGDPEKAEQCFVAGFENSIETNRPFKDWAHSWAKRAIIKNAIRIVQPHPGAAGPSIPVSAQKQSVRESLAALGDFERFVFVMSVLERYAERECSVLLGCSLQEIRAARIQAVKQLASSLTSTDSEPSEVNAGSLAEDRPQQLADDGEGRLVA